MSKLRIAAAALFLLSYGAAASEPLLRWRGHEFREIDSLTALPASIQRQLGVGESGLKGVADKGQLFNQSDLQVGSRPTRRLLAAGQDGNTWLVALEQGGFSYSVQVYFFPAGEPQQHWVLHGHLTTLQDVLRKIPSSDPADGH